MMDGYIDGFPEETRVLLRVVRRTIAEAAPEAIETLSYGIPNVRPPGEAPGAFAGFKKRVGFSPTPSGIEAFHDEVSGYVSAKGSVQFPVDRAMPLELISRITGFPVREVSGGSV